MALRDKIDGSVRPHLEPDEEVQVAFGALARNPMWSVWSAVRRDADRTVVVTNRRILVFRSGGSAFEKLNELERSLPRSLRIGEPRGLNWRCESLGERLWIGKRFHKAVRQADALAIDA